ncbi:Hypothetical predicted protein, partial [Pelobates cultripes]
IALKRLAQAPISYPTLRLHSHDLPEDFKQSPACTKLKEKDAGYEISGSNKGGITLPERVLSHTLTAASRHCQILKGHIPQRPQ